MYCTQEDWYNFNKSFRDWYFKEYPFLKDFSFPISHTDLKRFYVDDMENRNLIPLESFEACYESLFSYFLENYPRQDDPTRFKGKTFLERTLENLPEVIKESSPFKIFEGIGNLTQGVAEIVNIAGKFWWITIPIIIYIFLRDYK
jgi:hypothetical protein